MAIKKSELYSSIWKSCDELRGGMEPSEYKNYTSEGFVVFKGSAVVSALQKSCPENAVKLRERYKDKIDGNHILTEDLLFTSPSTAAAFVGGSSLNGNELWKTDAGVTLKHLDRTSD